MSEPGFGIVANVLSDRVLRTGARVWLHYVNGDAEKPIVTGVSKGGRVITKYIAFKRLTRFRAAWIPPHMTDRTAMSWPDKSTAQQRAKALAERWDDVRFFSRDGKTLIKNGRPAHPALTAPAPRTPAAPSPAS